MWNLQETLEIMNIRSGKVSLKYICMIIFQWLFVFFSDFLAFSIIFNDSFLILGANNEPVERLNELGI